MSLKWKIWFALVTPAVGLIVLIATFHQPIEQPRASLPERIQQECARDYGSDGTEAVLRCRLALSVRIIEEEEKRKLQSAYDRAR